jgi:hypothetical protein
MKNKNASPLKVRILRNFFNLLISFFMVNIQSLLNLIKDLDNEFGFTNS